MAFNGSKVIGVMRTYYSEVQEIPQIHNLVPVLSREIRLYRSKTALIVERRMKIGNNGDVPELR